MEVGSYDLVIAEHIILVEMVAEVDEVEQIMISSQTPADASAGWR